MAHRERREHVKELAEEVAALSHDAERDEQLAQIDALRENLLEIAYYEFRVKHGVDGSPLFFQYS